MYALNDYYFFNTLGFNHSHMVTNSESDSMSRRATMHYNSSDKLNSI